MEYMIENDDICIRISSRGAEMQSIKKRDGVEYLWQGDPDIWRNRATNIFPYIGRLTDGVYRYQGVQYELRRHGFLPVTELAVEKTAPHSITFSLIADDKIKQSYPFDFKYQITYMLVGNEIRIRIAVTNQGQREMYFGLGGHPGFFAPPGGEGTFEDCYFEFEQPARPVQVELTETGFVSGSTKEYVLRDGRYLDLRHDLFDRDAIVLKDMSRSVALRSKVSRRAVVVTYEQMDYLGFWHTPGTKAGFVCVEPWTSLPSRDGKIEDLEEQGDLVRLEAGACYQNVWSIAII